MERPGSTGVTFRNSLRFLWKNEDGEIFPELLKFNRDVLVGHFGLKIDEVRCVQRNNAQKFVDITLETEEDFCRVEEVCRMDPDAAAVKSFWVRPLWKLNYRVITVHVFNPFATEENIEAFLGRYVDVLPGSRKMRDSMGIWDGRRQFPVLLRQDPASMGSSTPRLPSASVGTEGIYFTPGNQSSAGNAKPLAI